MKLSKGVGIVIYDPINAKDKYLLAVMASKHSSGSAINGTMSKCPIMTSMEENIRRLDGNTIDSEVVDTKSVTDSSSSKCALGKSTVDGSGSVGLTDGIDSRKMESKAHTQSKTNCVQNTCTGCPCDAKTKTQDTGRHSQDVGASGTQSCSVVQIRKVSSISNVSFGGSEGTEEGERKLDLRGLIDSVGTLLIPVVSTIMLNPLLYIDVGEIYLYDATLF